MMVGGARFLVAGRAESESFRTLANVDISAGFAPMFSEIPETEFRRDIPSRHTLHASSAHTLQLLPSSERSTYVGAHVVVQESRQRDSRYG